MNRLIIALGVISAFALGCSKGTSDKGFLASLTVLGDDDDGNGGAGTDASVVDSGGGAGKAGIGSGGKGGRSGTGGIAGRAGVGGTKAGAGGVVAGRGGVVAGSGGTGGVAGVGGACECPWGGGPATCDGGSCCAVDDDAGLSEQEALANPTFATQATQTTGCGECGANNPYWTCVAAGCTCNLGVLCGIGVGGLLAQTLCSGGWAAVAALPAWQIAAIAEELRKSAIPAVCSVVNACMLFYCNRAPIC
jgi:hypothetical protein